MSKEKRFESMSDDELEYIAYLSEAPLREDKQALKEIYRRKQAKEQEISNDNKKIKRYTVIILVFTILAVIIGLVSLLVPFFFPKN